MFFGHLILPFIIRNSLNINKYTPFFCKPKLSFSIEVGICVATGSLSLSFNKGNIDLIEIFITFLMFVAQGMSEEVYCRGYLLTSISRRYSLLSPVLTNSLIFSCLHLLNPGTTIFSTLNVFLCGMVFSLIFIKTNNIWLVSGIHTMWNFVQGNIFGIQISGNSSGSSLLKSTLPNGNNIFNGGDFGIEGGIITSIVYFTIMIILLFLTFDKSSKKSI